MPLRASILVLAALFSCYLYGQINRDKATLSFGFEAGIPVNEFDENYNGNPAGLGVNIFGRKGGLPLYWGFDFGYASMGSNTYDIFLDDQNLDTDEATLRIKSNIFSYHIASRLNPFDGFFRPYVEGMAGIRTFATKTKISIEGIDGPYSTEVNSRDASFSYGLAGGLMISLGKNMFMEARLERIWGGDVEYVLQESVTINDEDEVVFETANSKADLFNLHLGLGFRF